MNNFEEKTKKQGTSQPEASNEKVNGDMAWEGEELELDDVQLATVVGGTIDYTLGDLYEQQRLHSDLEFEMEMARWRESYNY